MCNLNIFVTPVLVGHHLFKLRHLAFRHPMSPPLVHHQAYGYLLVVLLDRMQISHRPQTHRVTSKTSIVEEKMPRLPLDCAQVSYLAAGW